MARSVDGSDPSKVDRFLADRPLDGRRHELIEGTEVKSPALPDPHQAALERLAELLRAAAPAGLTTRPTGVMRDCGQAGGAAVATAGSSRGVREVGSWSCRARSSR